MEYNINIRRTGQKLKRMIGDAGYSVKDIQNKLSLTCPQSVYRWYAGTALPTVDHLYALSNLLDVSIEELLVIEKRVDITETDGFRYLLAYCEAFKDIA